MAMCFQTTCTSSQSGVKRQNMLKYIPDILLNKTGTEGNQLCYVSSLPCPVQTVVWEYKVFDNNISSDASLYVATSSPQSHRL